MPTRFTEQASVSAPTQTKSRCCKKAREHFETTLIGVQGELAGSVAAMEHRRADDALNYGEIFLRDNVPVMIFLMLEGRFAIVKQVFERQPSAPKHQRSNPRCLPHQLCGGRRRTGCGLWPALDRSHHLSGCKPLVADSLLDLRQTQWGTSTSVAVQKCNAVYNCCSIWFFTPASKAHRCCSFQTARS